jgi:hypothetical protein
MSWGGSVLGMINSLKANARKRPSLQRGYPRMSERDREVIRKVNYRKIKALTSEERTALRKKIELEKRLKSKQNVLAIFVSLILAALLLWFLNFLFHNHAETNPIF